MSERSHKFISPFRRTARIENEMRRLGWTWYRLAKELDVNQSALQRALKFNGPRKADMDDEVARALLSRRENHVTLKTVCRVADALGVLAGTLVDRSLANERDEEISPGITKILNKRELEDGNATADTDSQQDGIVQEVPETPLSEV